MPNWNAVLKEIADTRPYSRDRTEPARAHGETGEGSAAVQVTHNRWPTSAGRRAYSRFNAASTSPCGAFHGRDGSTVSHGITSLNRLL